MEYEVTGKTIEEAVSIAREKYDLGTDVFAYEVVEYPRSGFLGIGGRPAVIRISKNDPEPKKKPEQRSEKRFDKKPEKKFEKKFEKKEEPVVEKKREAVPTPETEKVEAFLRGILSEIGVGEYTLDVYSDNGDVDVVLDGEDLGFLTHKQGDAIDGLQVLLSLYLNKDEDDHHKVTVDVNNYKQKTVKRLESLAVRVAKQVLKTRRRVTLNPMTAYQRRIIHSKIQEFKNLTTASVGTEPNRRVVISYVWPEGQRKPRPEKEATAPQEVPPVSEESQN